MYVCMCVCMRVYACSESFKTAIGCVMYLAMCMCVYQWSKWECLFLQRRNGRYFVAADELSFSLSLEKQA